MTPPHELPCEYVRPFLPALLDGALEPAADRAARAHVAGCAGCGAVLAQQRRLGHALSRLGRAEVAPDGLRARVGALVHDARETSARRGAEVTSAATEPAR